MTKSRVFILIGQEIVRVGLRTLLRDSDEFVLVGETDNFEATEQSILKHNPDIVVIDYSQQQADTVEAIRSMKRAHPNLKVLIYTNDESEEIFFRSFHSGADGYLLRTSETKSIIDALKTLRAGELFFGPHISELMLKRFLSRPETTTNVSMTPADDLTPRETEILTLIALGLTNQEIADKLFISFRTVHTHRTNLMKKLNAHGTAQLVRYAIERGLVTAKP